MDTWRALFGGFHALDCRRNTVEHTMLAPSRKAFSGRRRVLPTSGHRERRRRRSTGARPGAATPPSGIAAREIGARRLRRTRRWAPRIQGESPVVRCMKRTMLLRCHGWCVSGTPRVLGHAQLAADVEEVVLDLALGEVVRRNHVVGGQLADGPQIRPPGPFDQPGELYVLDHAVSEL